MVIIASITTTAPASVAAGDIVGAFHNYATGDLRGKAVVQNIGGVYLCVIVVYYDTKELEDKLDLVLYSIDNDDKYYSSSYIAEGVVGTIEEPETLTFSDSETPEQ